MLKTLAAKHQSSVAKMAAKHRAKVETPYGLRTCYRGPGRTPRQAAAGRTVRRDTPGAKQERRSSSTVLPPTRSPTRERSWSAGS